MKISTVFGAVAMTVGVFVLTVPSFAHHSFAVEFDENNCRDFTGMLTRVDWQNPHAYFYLDITDDDGNVESWSFQTYALITLKRSGTDLQVFTENIGEEIWVRGCLAKTGREHYAAAGTLRFSDGILRQIGQLQDDVNE